jgi:ferredoxin
MSGFDNIASINVEEDVLGFVFPVYFVTIPAIVKNFASRLNFKTQPYIFGIATCNAVPGHSLFTLDQCLKEKGQALSSGFVVDMPGSALKTEPEVVLQRLKDSPSRIVEIANVVQSRSMRKLEGDNRLRYHMQSFVVGTLAKKLQFAPKRYTSTSECIGCRICEKVCPVKNIKVIDKRPTWGNNCANCLACYHWCPKQAVVINGLISKRNQYHHPDVTVKDISL